MDSENRGEEVRQKNNIPGEETKITSCSMYSSNCEEIIRL